MSSIWTMRRSATDAKVAGLCAGVARHWGVDPVLVRVGWAMLALSGGIGLVLYAAGWLLIPVEGKDRAPIEDVLGPQARRWPREVWIVIVAVAAVVTMATLGSIIPFGFGPAVILAAIWYFGYYRHRPIREDTTAPSQHQPGESSAATPGALGAPSPPSAQQFARYPGAPTPFTQAAEAWQRRILEAQQLARQQQTPPSTPMGVSGQVDVRGSSGPTVAPPQSDPVPLEPPAGPWSEPDAFFATADPVGLYTEQQPVTVAAAPVVKRADTRSARRLRLVSLVVLGLTLSSLGLAESLGAVIPLTVYLASALLVVGLTLVAAAWFGRARGLLLAGFALLLAVVTTTVSGPLAAQQGWETAAPRSYTAATLPASPDYLRAGQLKVDLRQLDLTKDTTYSAHVDYGSLEVTVPPDTDVRIQYQVGTGAYLRDGVEAEFGGNLHGTSSIRSAADGPTLTLMLSVDRGKLEVHR
ncbi:PspC domain-containing protein [Microlunatus panaciterrae]|uniref:Phage shock protein PspC (Stress-responsive transcriptional regulator) n=1 Tax=Microlunatus panaciterrae TaxID=400768 RepID=A0ABS2RKW3_9ACTN|nr:PspC domain-containing protein [Microlunatus panaciterrae]MBM7799648.1 phage shock protein PspC (stress-responsive transcriptional regulator) [Microlunatus panaciterrae]